MEGAEESSLTRGGWGVGTGWGGPLGRTAQSGFRGGPGGKVPGQEESARRVGPLAELRLTICSLPMAGRLWRGSPVGGRIVGGQVHQGPVTRGLLEGFELPGEHAAPADTEEGRQAPAQALG